MKELRMTSLPKSRGFSLVELMIGVALGLVVLAALTTFFVSSSSTRNEIERTSRQIENGRYAVDALRNELHLAGFYAELQTTGTTWTSTDPCLSASTTDIGLSLSPLNVPLPVFGYADGVTKPSCILNQVPGTDVIVIRRFNTEQVPLATAVLDAANYYWQPSRCRTDSTTTPWTFGTGNSGGFGLRTLNCAGPSNLYRMHVTIFYVRDYGYTPGDNIQTLVKLEVDRTSPSPPAVNGIVASPIAEGIANMRLEYGVDTDANGSPDQWRRCDAATTCDATQWSNVMAVRVHLLAVNLEKTVGYVDQKVYDMGTGLTAAGPFSDPYKRHVYAAVISLPNRTGPREQ
jgi:type IV pilus assembly protein PilW